MLLKSVVLFNSVKCIHSTYTLYTIQGRIWIHLLGTETFECGSTTLEPTSTAHPNYLVLSISIDIDEKLDKRDLYMVKISDAGAGDEYGIEDIPSLVYFEDGVPEIFTGRSCEVGVL